MKSGMAKRVVIGLLIFLVVSSSFLFGRKIGSAKPKITMFSQLTGNYLIDKDIVCPGPNGKNLGKLQVDLDLTNGKIRVVRNDPGKEPSCVK